MNKLPLARSTDIVVQTIGKEVLIYDLNTHRAYNLNETSSIVYHACDGNTTFSELKSKANFTDGIIFFAIDELRKNNLLENNSFVSPFNDLSRREVIKKVGLASIIALPVISSLVAPTAAMAQSAGAGGIADGQPSAVPSIATTDVDACYAGMPDSSCSSGVSHGAYNGIENKCVNRVCGAGSNNNF